MSNEQISVEIFSNRYFENYDGAGRSYDDHMKLSVTDPLLFHKHISALGLDCPLSMLDLGAADGSALLYFRSLIPSISTIHGVEISPYAYDRRRVDHLALGDIRDVLRRPSKWMLPKYDIVLMAAAMYLREEEFSDVIAAIGDYCHETTVILITTPGQYYGGGLYEYWQLAEVAMGERSQSTYSPKALVAR